MHLNSCVDAPVATHSLCGTADCPSHAVVSVRDNRLPLKDVTRKRQKYLVHREVPLSYKDLRYLFSNSIRKLKRLAQKFLHYSENVRFEMSALPFCVHKILKNTHSTPYLMISVARVCDSKSYTLSKGISSTT